MFTRQPRKERYRLHFCTHYKFSLVIWKYRGPIVFHSSYGAVWKRRRIEMTAIHILLVWNCLRVTPLWLLLDKWTVRLSCYSQEILCSKRSHPMEAFSTPRHSPKKKWLSPRPIQQVILKFLHLLFDAVPAIAFSLKSFLLRLLTV